jgi:hypothetical protein
MVYSPHKPQKGAIMKENQHTQVIPSTVLTQAQTKIDEAAAASPAKCKIPITQ